MTFSGVLFDFHRTLVIADSLETWLHHAEVESSQAVDPAGVLPVLREVWTRAAIRYPGTSWDLDPAIHRRAFQNVLTEESACTPALARALYDLMPSHWVPVPGALSLLGRLKAAGKRVGLLSNTALDLRPRLLELGLLPYLDTVVLSYEEGLVKPDPSIFYLAASRLGTSPVNTVYVGDTPASDGGAVMAGMPCILVPTVHNVPQLQVVTALLAP